MLSLATALTTGVVVTVSTLTARVPAELTLPARSVATTLIVVLPSAGTSALAKLTLQVPSVAVVVLLVTPQLIAMLAPVSAVPLTVTLVFSVAVTMLSVATALTNGNPTKVSIVIRMLAEAGETFPAASVTVPVKLEAELAVNPDKTTSIKPLDTSELIKVTSTS